MASAKLEDIVLDAWRKVFQAVNKIIEADDEFGFTHIEAKLNPGLNDLLHGLGVVEFILTYFLDTGLLEPDEARLAINSKQCVLHLRRVSRALKAGDEDEYKAAITDLMAQPQI